jgi:hypothetical protein
MATYPVSVELISDGKCVTEMRTPNGVAVFPAGTKLADVLRLMGDRYCFVGRSINLDVAAATMVASYRYASVYGGSGSGNGHHSGA